MALCRDNFSLSPANKSREQQHLSLLQPSIQPLLPPKIASRRTPKSISKITSLQLCTPSSTKMTLILLPSESSNTYAPHSTTWVNSMWWKRATRLLISYQMCSSKLKWLNSLPSSFHLSSQTKSPSPSQGMLTKLWMKKQEISCSFLEVNTTSELIHLKSYLKCRRQAITGPRFVGAKSSLQTTFSHQELYLTTQICKTFSPQIRVKGWTRPN